MSTKTIIIAIAVIVIAGGGYYLIRGSGSEDRVVSDETKELVGDSKDTETLSESQEQSEGVLESKAIRNLTVLESFGNPIVIDRRVESGTALSPECFDSDYLQEKSDYIVEAGISDITTDQGANTKTITFGIVAWLKGNRDTNEVQVMTGAGQHGESPIFEEGGIYKMHFWELDSKLYFVCGFAGVEDLGFRDWYCHDSDGGRNYFEKGTANVFADGIVYGPYSDACGGTILDEVVCSNENQTILSELYQCGVGCLAGACTN